MTRALIFLCSAAATVSGEVAVATISAEVAAATVIPEIKTSPEVTESGVNNFVHQLGSFLGFEANGDEAEDNSLDKNLQASAKTCASFKKCTKCVANPTCNWCDKSKLCAENSRPDVQCPTKSDYITSKWHCPDHLKWWGVLLIVIACVCCCPLISALCFFFVIKKFCCGD